MEIKKQHEIRLANNDDINDLVRLLHELFTQDSEFEPDYEKQKSGLEIIINNPEIGEILVVLIGGRIVGMVNMLYSVSTVLGGKVVILEDMIIEKKFRKNGFGLALLSEAIRYSREKQFLRITLLTDYNNEIAINFYRNLGFTKSQMIPMRLVF